MPSGLLFLVSPVQTIFGLSLVDDGGVPSASARPAIANVETVSASISACRRQTGPGPAPRVVARTPDVSPMLARANTLKATSVRYDSSSDVVLRESSDARVNRRVDKMPNSGSAKQMIPERCTTATVIDRIFRHVPRHCERSEAIHCAAKKEWIASSLRSSQ